MTQNYSQPIISDELGSNRPNAAAERNYFARGVQTPALFEIDGNPIPALVAEFGSPLFVFSEHALRHKARHAREAFKQRYPRTSFAWSLKTNPLKGICQILRQEGWLAEVVSDFEYEKARDLGFAGPEILFNGPYKPRAILERAIEEGALLHVDNWDELNLIEKLVEKRRQPLDVGIRVWLDAGIRPVWSKFGFALANGEAERAAERIVRNPALRLHTLHTHIGTYILEPAAYRTATQKLLALRDALERKHGHLIDCLDLGGGFPSNSLLHGMTGPAEQMVPPIEAYADAITEVLNRLPEKKRPLLRLETGRHLVDEAGYLLTSVVAVKGVHRSRAEQDSLSARDYKEQLIAGEDSKVNYILDAGINLLYTAAWYRFEVRPSRLIDKPPMPSRLYGSLCMAIDVIRDYVDLPPLEVGDVLSLHPVGAYNLSQSMQFIAYRPAVVLIGEDGTAHLIRLAETLEEVQRLERLPDHLAER
ncbi:alanine racemase [Pseudomonas sp. S5(2021)]|nr:alanine racemase [Pseudomonas sp. S5(2021)]